MPWQYLTKSLYFMLNLSQIIKTACGFIGTYISIHMKYISICTCIHIHSIFWACLLTFSLLEFLCSDLCGAFFCGSFVSKGTFLGSTFDQLHKPRLLSSLCSLLTHGQWPFQSSHFLLNYFIGYK